jgi:hypothetical protein
MKIESSTDQTEPTPPEYGVIPLRFEKTYYGERRQHCGGSVWVEETSFSGEGHAAVCLVSKRVLPFYLDGVYHPPSFSWGFAGFGAEQLAFALLSDVLGDTTLAQEHYQDFQFEIVAGFPNSWSITAKQIRDFVQPVAATQHESPGS